jgi:hypothetical protein
VPIVGNDVLGWDFFLPIVSINNVNAANEKLRLLHAYKCIYLNSYVNISREAVKSSWQGQCSAKEDNHDGIWKQGREPDDIATLMKASPNNKIDQEPTSKQSTGKFPLEVAEAVLNAIIHLENTVAKLD